MGTGILTLKNKPPGRARGRARATEVLSPGRGGDYFLEPSVAQPPLPLQEFLPLQPLSPVLQPPLPLQEFSPLQACFSLTALEAFLVVLPLAELSDDPLA